MTPTDVAVGQVWENVTRRHGNAGHRIKVFALTTNKVRGKYVGPGWNRSEKPVAIAFNAFFAQYRRIS